MTHDRLEIKDVTDTALWIAAYRAEESARKDALFRDHCASLLLGDAGNRVAIRTQGSRYTAWSVVIRTFIIDQFIQNLLKAHPRIDTVLNLGAGLDTRPYRLPVPSDLKWIEVDFTRLIDLKNEKLKNEKPLCQLKRVSLDLSDNVARENFLAKIAGESKQVLVLTEGVIPYLTNEEARALALNLKSFSQFSHWITEYYSPEILVFLRTPKRLKQMEHSPFLFYPDDWFGFYKDCGWNEVETKYFGVESEKLGRTPPTPGWLKEQKEKVEEVKYYLGYSVFSASGF